METAKLQRDIFMITSSENFVDMSHLNNGYYLFRNYKINYSVKVFYTYQWESLGIVENIVILKQKR